MAIYAVGDIQGCYDPLMRLLDKVKFDQSKDTLLCVGDLVNRGPNCLEVLKLLKSLENQCVTVLGNHDIHLLAMIYGIRKPRHTDTFTPILKSPEVGDLADWLRQKPLLVVDDKHRYTLSHAGIYPWWNKQQTIDCADEIHRVFKSENKCIRFLNKVYGNTPNKWTDSLGKVPRRRFIINAFTRMRFCSPSGSLNLKESGYKGKYRKNRVPWFDFVNPDFVDYRIIFGHWSALGFLNRPNYLALDTGCVWGKHLTLVKLPKKPGILKPIKKSNIFIAPNVKL